MFLVQLKWGTAVGIYRGPAGTRAHHARPRAAVHKLRLQKALFLPLTPPPPPQLHTQPGNEAPENLGHYNGDCQKRNVSPILISIQSRGDDGMFYADVWGSEEIFSGLVSNKAEGLRTSKNFKKSLNSNGPEIF